MRILFLTYDFVYPTNSGGKVRAYNLIRYSASKEFEIDVFSFTRGNVSREDIKKLQEIGVENVVTHTRNRIDDPRNFPVLLQKNSIFKTLYYKKDIEMLLIDHIQKNKIDILHCESYYMGFYITEKIRETGVKIIFGSENIEQVLYQEYVDHKVSSFLKPLYQLQVKQITHEENSMIQNANAAIAVTENEADFIKKLSQKKCYVIPNGVEVDDFTYTPRTKKERLSVLFIGNFTYFPNTNAMKYFFDELYPKLAETTTITIIGKKSTQLFGSRPQVVAKEYLEDIRDEYKKADVFLFPVKFGGGTNFKVLEAMASGVPVVGFAEKIESTGAKDGQHYIAAHTTEEYLKVFERISQEDISVTTITKNARKLIEDYYNWKSIGKALQKSWKEVYED